MASEREPTERCLAKACRMPAFSGDGYDYGGGAVLMIGDLAIPLGEGMAAHALAEEIARRWNAMEGAADGQ